MNESNQLDKAVGLAADLFRLEFERVDAVNVRLGRFWLGLVLPLRRPEWRVWEVVRDQAQPIDPMDGIWLDSFEDLDEAVATLVSCHVADAYETAAHQLAREQV